MSNFNPSDKMSDQDNNTGHQFFDPGKEAGVSDAFSSTEMGTFGNPLQTAQVFDFDKVEKNSTAVKKAQPLPEIVSGDNSDEGEVSDFNGTLLKQLTPEQQKSGVRAIDLQGGQPPQNKGLAASAYMLDGVMYIYLDFYDIYKADGYEHKAFAYSQRLAYGMSEAGIEQYGSVVPITATTQPPPMIDCQGKQVYRSVYRLTPRI